jgi:hypothetical protein
VATFLLFGNYNFDAIRTFTTCPAVTVETFDRIVAQPAG